MEFCIRFFIALLAVCVAPGAWAECCWCDCPTTGCLCPSEIDFDGYDGYGTPICVNPCPNVDCSYCGEQPGAYCDGYDDPCPFGETPGKKCKKIGNCPAPCQLYERCDTANGATEQQMSGACHVENNTCYSNTRACNDFSSLVYNFGQVTCLTQSGNAGWNSGKWDVSGCSCDVPSVSNNLNDYFRCTQFGTHVGLYPNQNVQSVDNSILYMVDRLYCEKCPAGYLPTITDASSGDIYARPENTSGNWGVITCDIQVQVPDYAPGCVIDFNSSMDNMMAECRKTCPTGFATEAPGATNVEDCQYDGHTTYTDDTGTFYIGSLDDCP